MPAPDPDRPRLGVDDIGDPVERHLPTLLLAGAAFEALMAVRNAFALPAPARVVMPVLQGLFAAALLLGWLRFRARPVRHSEAQPLIAAAITVTGLLVVVEQAMTGQGLLAANLSFAVVAAGALLVSTRAFATVVAVLVAGWLVAVAAQPEWEVPVGDQALLVGVAVMLATFVHVLRVSGRRELLAALDHAVDTALRDDLTGLWNRRGAREATRPLIGQARRDGQPVWCVFLDVRGLKAVNDVLGHAEGDRLILAVGRTLAPYADAGLVPVRWGGDEFALFGDGPAPDVAALVEDLRRAMDRSLGALDQPWDLSPGLGASRSLDRPDVLERLVRRADEDMYRRRRRDGAAAAPDA